MANLKFITALIFLIVSATTFGQSIKDREIELAYHADVMVNATEAKHRIQAMNKFNPLFEETLGNDGSFAYPFDSLKWISKKMPPDKSFKIYTWEVKISEDEVKYFGFLQKGDGTLFPLKDDFKNAEGLADEEYSHENWLGSLYYNIMEEKTAKGQKYYMLFGVNKWSKYENVKLIDILFFSKDGLPYFGLPVFKKKVKDQNDEIYNRLAFKYATDAQMTLNYNPGMQMIMVDNLIRKMSRLPGQPETLVPDGSYVGYSLEDGYWNRIDKIATEVMDTAPRPKPVLDARKNKNIMGKDNPVKNKK
jgi:hypothetical protein